MPGKDDKKNDGKQTPVAVEVKRHDVTLVKKGQNQWQVLTSDGKDLVCECGRHVEASLHNISVDNTKLGPCSVVNIISVKNKK